MNERERWIVYPLLFLALGAALRDKLSEHTTTKILESEHVKTKTLECQEIVVYSDESAGRQPVPLVQVGAMQLSKGHPARIGRLEINGQLLVNGPLEAQGIQSESIQASNVNAENYYFRRVPFVPALLRAMPGVSPADWLRALQQSVQSPSAGGQPSATPPAAHDESTSPLTPLAK
jgi:hypothetical protein